MLRFIVFSTLVFSCFTLKAQIDSTKAVAKDAIERGELVVNAHYRVDELMAAYKKTNEGKQISGYRIQLFSGRRQEAFELKAEFMKQLSETPITVVYESPDFKVQAGNYRTKLSAEKAMEYIWPLFKSAFVVETTIDLPQLPIEQESE